MAGVKAKPLPDARCRARIEADLDTNFLVEAAAGTGKTTSLVRRMVALVASGKAVPAQIAAVTFTRKAASELSARFVLELERARARARGGKDPERAALLNEALESSGRCFVGTIHSFCARLIRERPVEAGVDPGFAEMDEVEDARLARVAWEEQMSGLADDPLKDRLLDAGLSPNDLFGLFATVAGHPDVNAWPAPDPVPPDLAVALGSLDEYLARVRALLPALPAVWGSDSLIPRIRRVHLMARNARDIARPLTLFRIFRAFEAKVTVRHKYWPGGKDQALAEERRFEEFRDSVALPAVNRFMAYRYAVAVEAVLPAVERYRRMRNLQGSLNYEDLLLKAAALLRENPGVRRFFQDRYRRLLVDEFQDTDPVQAEVMMLLASDRVEEKDWRRCTPRPGSLFVVGDPKQSIYRFRRADIVVYNEVRDIVAGRGGGEMLELSSNFRSRREILDWVNVVFEPMFPRKSADEAPRYVALESGRSSTGPVDLRGVRTIPIPARCGNKDLVMKYEPDRIARTIRSLVDSGATVTGREGTARPCVFGDFMVVTVKKEHLSPFSTAMDRWGIPHQVSGGAALNGIKEIHDLYLAVAAAARPHDPVAFLAVMRSELFGFSDADLLALRRSGGQFRWDRPLPDGLDAVLAANLADANIRLHGYATWLSALPPVPAIECILEDLGIAALASFPADGDVRAGSVFTALEILRQAASERPSLDHVLETFRLLVTGEEEHDGAAARPAPPSFVRIMNLHKAKGLESAVVFLASPVGEWSTEPSLHIVRDGGTVAGYAQVMGPARRWGGRPPAEAFPPGWVDRWSVRERAFLEAELSRLLYVAATRAGSMLVISRMEGRANSHPWSRFYDHLGDAAILEDPGEITPPERKETPLGPDDQGDPAVYLARLSALKDPTYGKESPSAFAAPGAEPQPPSGEHGTEWGTVVHRLLESTMGGTVSDSELTSLAETLLLEEGLPAGQAGKAARLARSVTASRIWKRAWAAGPGRRLTEVPYTFMKSSGTVPTLLSGVIDLVFKEGDGWVIVDYKTGAVAPDKHRPQLLAYKEAWEAMGCGKVKEAGAYYVDSGEYVVVPREGGPD